jgi:hypothetical protein
MYKLVRRGLNMGKHALTDRAWGQLLEYKVLLVGAAMLAKPSPYPNFANTRLEYKTTIFR